MKSNKIGRVNSEIQSALSQILTYEMNNPLLKNVLISVLKVDTTADLKYAKVVLSIYPDDNKDNIFNAIKSSLPYLRRELANKISLRITPEIVVSLDDSEKYASKIEVLLSKIRDGEKKWFLMIF